MVERLDRVLGGPDHAVAPRSLERRARLGEHRDEEPEEQQVADDPAHVRQPAPEHEQRERPPSASEPIETPQRRASPGQRRGARRRTRLIGSDGAPAPRPAGASAARPPVEEKERDREERLAHRDEAVEEHAHHEVVELGPARTSCAVNMAKDSTTTNSRSERPEDGPAPARGERRRAPPDGDRGGALEHDDRVGDGKPHEEDRRDHGDTDEEHAHRDGGEAAARARRTARRARAGPRRN